MDVWRRVGEKAAFMDTSAYKNLNVRSALSYFRRCKVERN
jgi:hypothetical protein